MAVVFSSNVIEIAVIQTYVGRPVVNVMHMWFDRELGTDTKTDVVEDVRDNWQDHVMLRQVDGVSIVRFDWRSLDPNDNEVGTVPPDPAKGLTGTLTQQGAPPNVALLVTKRTSDRPRGRRDGRFFIAGPDEAVVGEAGEISTVNLTNFQSAWTAFYDGISDTSGSAAGDRYPCVLETTPASRAPGSASVTIGSRRVTSFVVDPLVATQRDRLR